MSKTTDTRYDEYLSRKALQASMADGGITDESVDDLSGGMEESAGADEVMKARQAQDQAALAGNRAQGGGELEKVGGATMAAGAIGGNPAVAGAGLALQTIGAVDSAHRASEQSKIDNYNKKIMAQRSAIRNIFA